MRASPASAPVTPTFHPRVTGRLRGRRAELAAALLAALSVGGAFAAPPERPGPISGTVDGDRVALSWVAARDDEGVTGYNIYRDGRYLTTVRGTTSAVVGLGAGARTRFHVNAFDSPTDGSARGFSPRSPSATFSRAAAAPNPAPPAPTDGTPSTVTGPDAEPAGDGVDPTFPTAATRLVANRVSPTRVRLSWAPATDDRGVRGYNVYRDRRYVASVNTPGFVDDAGVVPGRSHDYYVVAYDRPRNFGPHSAVATAPASSGAPAPVTPTPIPIPPPDSEPAPEPSPTTPAEPAGPVAPDTPPEPDAPAEPSVPDTTPPVAVTGLRSPSAAPGRVELRWRAPEDDIRGYNVYRDDDYVTTVNGAPRWVDTRLPADATRAVYRVVAFDTAGNFSPYSGRLTVTIDAAAAPAPSPSEPTPAPEPAPTPEPTPPVAAPPTAPVEGPAAGDPSDPSVPTALSARLVSYDWVELQWQPAEGAVAYNVYRDGTLLYTVDSTKTGGQDRRYWTTTSYVDCDFTRFLICGEQAPEPGGAYVYAVTAVDADGTESGASNALPVRLLTNERLDVAGTLADFRLVLEDEFDGGALDTDVWNTRLPWGPDVTINGERQYFVDTKREPDFGYDPFVFTDDTLRIVPSVTPPALAEAANGQPFLSGAITTRDAFNFTYGYVEARARLAKGRGKLSSFFLFHQWSALNAAEIDIAEYLGERPDSVSQNYHWRDERDDETQHPSPTMFEDRPGEPFHADFHTYGVLWEPGLVVWTIDGEEILRLSGPEVSRQASYVILYLVTGSAWTEQPDPTDPDFAVPLEIDWLRVWQRPAFIRE